MVSNTYNPTLGSVFDYHRSAPRNYFSLDTAIVVLGCVLLVAMLALPYMLLANINRADAARVALVPTLTEQQYVAYHRMLETELAEPAGSIDRFFKIQKDLEKLPQLTDKFARSARRPVPASVSFIQQIPAADGLWTKYAAKYGYESLRAATDIQTKLHTYSLNPFGEGKYVPAYGWASAGTAYGLSVLIAMLFFAARIWREGYKVRHELFNVLLYSPIWLYKVWTYPSNIDPVESAKRVLRYAAYTLSAFLSIGSAGGAFAKATQRSAYESDTSDVSNTYVLDALPTIPTPSLVATFGWESQKIIGNAKVVQKNSVAFQDLTASWDNGWSFDYWASESIGHPGTSDERDWTIKKVWSLPSSQSLITGVGYYDIQPIASMKNGDVLNPFGEWEVPLTTGLTGYVRGDAYHITGGPNGRDGFLVQIGLRESEIKLPLGFELGGKASVLYEKGPFRAEPGYWARGDVSLSHSILNGRATLGVNVTGFVPLSHIAGAAPDHTVQLTLSAPLN